MFINNCIMLLKVFVCSILIDDDVEGTNSLWNTRESFDRKRSLSSSTSVAAGTASERSIFVGRLIGGQFNDGHSA